MEPSINKVIMALVGHNNFFSLSVIQKVLLVIEKDNQVQTNFIVLASTSSLFMPVVVLILQAHRIDNVKYLDEKTNIQKY